MNKFFFYAKQLMFASIFCAGLTVSSCDDGDDPVLPDPAAPVATVVAPENGQVSVSAIDKFGANATVTVKANDGYELDKLYVAGKDVTSEVVDGTYSMNYITEDFEVKATFKSVDTADPEPSKEPDSSSSLAYKNVKVVTYKQQYAAPTINIDATWKNLTVVFVEKPADVQFCATSDAVESEQSWGTAYYSTYPAIEDATATLDLAAVLKELKGMSDAVTKIVTIGLQFTAKTADENSVAKVKAVIATKADGTQELVDLVNPGWGLDITDGDAIASEPAKEPAKEPEAAKLTYDNVKIVTYKQQYAAPTINIDATWTNLTVVFVEKPANVQFCATSDAVESEQSWGTAYYSTYPAIEDATATLDLAAVLKELKGMSDAVTKIVTIGLQFTAKTADENSVAKVKAVIATKADGTQVLVDLVNPGWGLDITDGDAL